MSERPILFSAPMIRALLAGTKTQTRRIVRHQYDGAPQIVGDGVAFLNAGRRTGPDQRCPYGVAGDRLWVRETFSGPHCMEKSPGKSAIPPAKWGRSSSIWYWADGDPADGDWTRPRPSIFMPRWASRITLEITDVRVERLQEISVRDVIAEGCSIPSTPAPYKDACGELVLPHKRTASDGYRALWDSINGKKAYQAWLDNPWVWVVSFRKVTT